jgi:hypothetical protein
MKRRVILWFGLVAAILIVLTSGFFYQQSLAYVRAAPEDRNGLWMAALKGFSGTVRYVGSIDDYSYFRAGDTFCSRYKAPTAKLQLPRTFSFGEGAPYEVAADMVPEYP